MADPIKEPGSAPAELLTGHDLRIGITVARFNPHITQEMLSLCAKRLSELGTQVDHALIVETPGSYELPLAARMLIEREHVDAVIAIGAVVRGETNHYEHIANAASRGLLRVADDTRVPIIFGVLTVDTIEQALARVPLASGYADAAIEMVNRYRMLGGNHRKIGLI